MHDSFHAALVAEQHCAEALLVHRSDARVAVALLGAQGLDLHRRARVDAFRDLSTERASSGPE